MLGESVRAELVAAATERLVDEVIESLERAADAGMIQPVGRQLGRYAFVHTLFRDGRYHALSSGRRLRLHAAVTRALAPYASDPSMLPELARHACIAAPVGDAGAAVRFARDAGAASAIVGDFPAAAQHFERALDVIDLASDTDEHVRLALTVRLGEVLVPTSRVEGTRSSATPFA